MLGQTAYTLKHIETNEKISISKLRRDVTNGNLKAHKEGNFYYVLESDLNRYLDK
jgi:hypothetical protein